jgi:ParB-like chromosome segregation protein Spo0J
MAESIESLQSRPPLEVIELPVDRLDPDPDNPNEVSPKLMKALQRDIAERGFVQPVLVRPAGKRYAIIDGEHRWKVLQAMGAETVPCVIDDADPDQARMRMVTMNRLRGKFDPARLAGVLKGLAETMDEDELMERLGMDPDEFETSLHEVDEGALNRRLAEAMERERSEAPTLLRLRAEPREAQAINKAVEAMTAKTGMSRASALIKLLERPS